MHLRRPIPIRLLALAAALVAGGTRGQAQTVAWTGSAGNGLWSTGTNWSTSAVPATSTDVLFDNRVSAAQTVSLNGSRTVDDLQFTGNDGYTLTGGSSDTLIFDSADNATSTLTVAANSSGSASHSILVKLQLENALTINQQVANRTLTFSRTVNAQENDITFSGTGSIRFTQNVSNVDDFTKTGSGTVTFAGTVAGFDSFTLAGGTLALESGGHLVGESLIVTGNSLIDFGTGSSSQYLEFGQLSIAAGVTLTLRNWTDAIDYFLVECDPGSVVNQIVFEGTGTYAVWDPYDSKIKPGTTPVPEPGTYGALATAAALGLFLYRRRVAPHTR